MMKEKFLSFKSTLTFFPVAYLFYLIFIGI